jgi:hypothetical protein
MIYTHVMAKPGLGVRSPMDESSRCAIRGSFPRTVLETLPLMRRRPMLDAPVALGDETDRPQTSALDKRGRVGKGVS